MARTWDEKNNDLLKIERETAAYQAGKEAGANEVLQIAGATGQGGSPGQSYQRPLQNPDPGEAVFGVEKDGQTFFEFLKAMGIFFPVRVPKNDPNAGKPPFDDKGNDLSVPVPGRPDWAGTNKDMKIAHGKYFDDDGRIKKKPRGMTPSGKPFDMPVDEEQQKKNKERHDRLYHPDLMISHVNKDGTAHSGGPEHDFMHGRRGTNTWPDGRRKYSDEELKQIDEYMKSLMISQSPAALDALRKGKAPGLSSQQIRSLIKPFTKPDQFGHPTGSLRV